MLSCRATRISRWKPSPCPERMRRTGMLTCYPHRMKGEGHFVALLRKHGDAPCNWQKAPEKDTPSKDALQALHTFCRRRARM